MNSLLIIDGFGMGSSLKKMAEEAGPIRTWKKNIAHNSNNYRRVREYKAWFSAKRRCENPHDKRYRYYGGRGIRMCDHWQDFENFYRDMGPAPAGTTLDREDNDKDYEPGNCRWATYTTNNRNRSNSLVFSFNGQIRHLIDLCREFGVNYSTATTRLRRGWSIHKVLKGK